MELRCLQSPTVSSIPRSGLIENSFLRGHNIIKLLTNRKNCAYVRRTQLLDLGARSSGITKIKSQAQDATRSSVGAKDGNLVFVAGATGKVGSRAVRELIKLGFNVRAGVRNTKKAESLVQSVQKMKLEDVAGGTKTIDKLKLVECDLEKPDQIGPALGNSSIVMCCIGASEKEIFDTTGPYRIDYLATKNLIDAATSAKVDHFILLTSLGTNKVGFPAAILNLFWGVLVWKRKAEEALLASGLPYTIVRPGGMERPTDSYKDTHNITLSDEDTLFGGQVSNLQVAELMAFMAKNRGLSYCKVVEVIAETSAPLIPMGELLKKIPSGREEIDPPKEPDDANDSVQIPSSTYAEREPEQTKPIIIATALSPYIAYEDLKPPTSPTPIASSGSGVTKASKTEILFAPTSPTSSVIEVLDTSSIVIDNGAPKIEPKKQNLSSPYANYEDLKPPTSPTPTPCTGSGATEASKIDISPTERTQTSSTSSSIEANSSETSSTTVEIVIPQTATKKQYPSSPYTNYEDLKPPCSPTPCGSKKKEPSELPTPMEVVEPQPPSLNVSEVSGNSTPDNPVNKESSGNINHHTELKARPLSPYTMYEELKPPSSPLPLASKV